MKNEDLDKIYKDYVSNKMTFEETFEILINSIKDLQTKMKSLSEDIGYFHSYVNEQQDREYFRKNW